MLVQQIYTGCLSEAAYFVESKGEAIVIDPLRDIETYIQLAKENNATIKYIFETHFHADFISGHLDLTKKTGAPIVYGPNTEAGFSFHLAKNGEIFKIGEITLEVIHTPGHTLESTCYLLRDENGKPNCIFTGDTLFIGDVGRPDLSSGNISKEELAGNLYESIQNKLMPLPDDIIVYPAHGPGSSCGKNIGPETQSTIGNERKTNYAMKPQTKEDFIKSVTEGLEEAPTYFALNAKINKEGYHILEDIIDKGLTPLSIEEFKNKIEEGYVILDTRKEEDFANGFIPGAVFIGLEGRFAEWAGNLLSFEEPIILVTPFGKEEETIIRLARVGFDKVSGYLNGGFNAWQNSGEKTDLIINIDVDELAMDIPFDDNLLVVDVRKPNEFSEGHVKNAMNLPLAEMTDIAQIASLEEDQNIYIHCEGGYRSTIANSLLKRQGYHNVRNVPGGWTKIKEEKKIPTEKEASLLN
ncbi:MAG: rhodanese-like domain-containing protein [Bacteroidota bacterium]|jgi:hydroxyacylglutathione hydrolase|nr:rhodanese-like domain-containing protein [Bacteroidota bacterium]